MKLNTLPQEIAKLTPKEFLELCESRDIGGIGLRWAKKIIDHASGVLPCKTAEAFIHLHVLQANLKQLEELEKLIKDMETQIHILFHQTSAVNLLSIQGLGVITAAEFIAEIGDINKYCWPGQWVKFAGLHVSRYQTGTTDRKENHITKVGNRNLRYIVFTIARNISRWDSFFSLYKERLCNKGKHIGRVYGAVANKFMRVAFYMIKNKTNFDRDYEKKKEKD